MLTSAANSIAATFLSSLTRQVPSFVQAFESTLADKYHLDVSSFEADHVCWRTESLDEYSNLVGALLKCDDSVLNCELLIESIIGGRPIATFSLHDGIPVPSSSSSSSSSSTSSSPPPTKITTKDRSVHVIEIPAPKDGSPYKGGLEHVEFVIDSGGGSSSSSSLPEDLSPLNDEQHQTTFQDFMVRHSSLPWSTKAKDKSINPDISVKIELGDFGTCSVKFHLMPLAQVIEYEKKHDADKA